MADNASVLLKIRVQDTVHTIDRLTLGDWRILKTEFGLDVPDIFVEFKDDKGEDHQAINFGDPNVLVGLLVVALHHERPKAPIRTLIAEVEAVGMDEFEFLNTKTEDEAEAEDPTEAGDAGSEETAGPVKSGKSGKPRSKPGTQS